MGGQGDVGTNVGEVGCERKKMGGGISGWKGYRKGAVGWCQKPEEEADTSEGISL